MRKHKERRQEKKWRQERRKSEEWRQGIEVQASEDTEKREERNQEVRHGENQEKETKTGDDNENGEGRRRSENVIRWERQKMRKWKEAENEKDRGKREESSEEWASRKKAENGKLRKKGPDLFSLVTNHHISLDILLSGQSAMPVPEQCPVLQIVLGMRSSRRLRPARSFLRRETSVKACQETPAYMSELSRANMTCILWVLICWSHWRANGLHLLGVLKMPNVAWVHRICNAECEAVHKSAAQWWNMLKYVWANAVHHRDIMHKRDNCWTPLTLLNVSELVF